MVELRWMLRQPEEAFRMAAIKDENFMSRILQYREGEYRRLPVGPVVDGVQMVSEPQWMGTEWSDVPLFSNSL